MTEPRLISPLLDNYIIGGPISDHCGVSCCPAMQKETNKKHIVKIISIPSFPSQIDALLLSGAFADEESVLLYFKNVADSVAKEADVLSNLAEQEGFVAYEGKQIVKMPSGKGYEVYLLSTYKNTLEKRLLDNSLTHLDALNFGIDLCSALSACRRSGYLYVDLKPGNVFISDDRLYQIGDIGFISLDSLKFASMPEKYLSMYTPPEISDAFSALNHTIDSYAVGMILYQIYNNGCLPFSEEIKPGCELPAPANADQELSEIILKACAVNPGDRWQDPMQMGQALIGYMQLNGANDVLIAPTAVPENEETETCDVVSEVVAAGEAEDVQDITDEHSADYSEVTEEVSQMLNQADDLVSHSIPEPVVAPDYIEVQIPEQACSEDASETCDKTLNTPVDVLPSEAESKPASTKKMNLTWLRYAAAVLFIAAIIAGGLYYYQNHYLLPVNGITVSGNDDTLTVQLTTDVDDSLLQVICSDIYGNQHFSPVENGKAVFIGLIPNSSYSIRIAANGFHKMTGTISAGYSTPMQSKILQFDAVTGITAGSVILSFSVDGPDSKEWTVHYFAEGEEERYATFSSHIVTLTNLTVGKEYTFRLSPKQELSVSGQTELHFTTSPLIKAENLTLISCMNNEISVIWEAPGDTVPSSWSVRCTGPNYSQTVVTSQTSATFKDIDHTQGYVIEVKAQGMSVSQGLSIPANTVTVLNFKSDQSDPSKLLLSWETNAPVPEDGWILHYSIQGINADSFFACSKNEAVIFPVVANSSYRVWLEDTKGNALLNSENILSTGTSVPFYWEFSNFSIGKEDLTFAMCRVPNVQNWGKSDLTDSCYTTAFKPNERAAFLVYNSKSDAIIGENVIITFVIRGENGMPISKDEQTFRWSDMWLDGYCPLEMPKTPSISGKYTVEIYFNGGIVTEQQFTVTQ